MNECTTTSNGVNICVDCTGQPAITHVPPFIQADPNLGWNAGANSDGDHRFAGDVVGEWNIPLGAAGCIVGLAPAPHTDVTHPETLTHAWYAFTVNGATFVQPMQLGVLKGEPTQIFGTVTLKILRFGGIVAWSANGTQMYDADAGYDTLTLLGACLFCAGDAVQ